MSQHRRSYFGNLQRRSIDFHLLNVYFLEVLILFSQSFTTHQRTVGRRGALRCRCSSRSAACLGRSWAGGRTSGSRSGCPHHVTPILLIIASLGTLTTANAKTMMVTISIVGCTKDHDGKKTYMRGRRSDRPVDWRSCAARASRTASAGRQTGRRTYISPTIDLGLFSERCTEPLTSP